MPVVLAGDYNVVPSDQDIYPTKSWDRDARLKPESRAAYQRLLAQGWTDAIRVKHPGEPMYTFSDHMRKRWERDVGLRLDHILVSPTLADRIHDAGVDRTARGKEYASDHAPRLDDTSRFIQTARFSDSKCERKSRICDKCGFIKVVADPPATLPWSGDDLDRLARLDLRQSLLRQALNCPCTSVTNRRRVRSSLQRTSGSNSRIGEAIMHVSLFRSIARSLAILALGLSVATTPAVARGGGGGSFHGGGGGFHGGFGGGGFHRGFGDGGFRGRFADRRFHRRFGDRFFGDGAYYAGYGYCGYGYYGYPGYGNCLAY